MGKGDKRSKKGKIWKGSFGNSRRKKKTHKAVFVPKIKTKVKKAPAPVEAAVAETPVVEATEVTQAEAATPKVKKTTVKKAKAEGDAEKKPVAKKEPKKKAEPKESQQELGL